MIRRFLRNWAPPTVGSSRFKGAINLARQVFNVTERPEQFVPDGGVPADLKDLRTAPLSQVLWIPMEKIRFRHTATAPTAAQSHFVRYFRDGIPSMARYYHLHRPSNQMETAFLFDVDEAEFRPVAYPSSRSPWGFLETDTGAGKLSAREGCSWHGPVSKRKLEFEANRLGAVRESVERRGFWKFPDVGFLQFRLLIDDGDPTNIDYRVLILGGQHRVAYLAHLGWNAVPMLPAQPTLPEMSEREIRLSDLPSWPGVLDRSYSPLAAGRYFRAFFRNPEAPLIPNW